MRSNINVDLVQRVKSQKVRNYWCRSLKSGGIRCKFWDKISTQLRHMHMASCQTWIVWPCWTTGTFFPGTMTLLRRKPKKPGSKFRSIVVVLFLRGNTFLPELSGWSNRCWNIAGQIIGQIQSGAAQDILGAVGWRLSPVSNIYGFDS